MITQRIKDYIDYKKITVSSFEVSIGASNGMLRRAFVDKADIRSQWLEKILEKYHDINPRWLLTGKGEMLKSDNDTEHIRTHSEEDGKKEPLNLSEYDIFHIIKLPDDQIEIITSLLLGYWDDFMKNRTFYGYIETIKQKTIIEYQEKLLVEKMTKKKE